MNAAAEDPVAAYCEALIRFIATQLLDPHRYFEQKLLGQLALSDTGAARAELLRRLVHWVTADELLTVPQRERFDAGLARRRWPSTKLVEREPELAMLLLQGAGIAAAREPLTRALGDSGLREADRNLIRSCLRQPAG